MTQPKENNNSQQPLKKTSERSSNKSYEGENALKQSAITNGEMESSPALIKGSPADTTPKENTTLSEKIVPNMEEADWDSEGNPLKFVNNLSIHITDVKQFIQEILSEIEGIEKDLDKHINKTYKTETYNIDDGELARIVMEKGKILIRVIKEIIKAKAGEKLV